MKKFHDVIMIFMLVFLFYSCATSTPIWESKPNLQQLHNENYDVTISPIFILDGYKGFILTIHNKSNSKLEVIWDDIYYLNNGKSGRFLFEGRKRGKKTNEIDVVPANETMSKEIFPENLAYTSKIAAATVYKPMEAGNNGVYLTVSVNGKRMSEEITLDIIASSGK